MSLRESVVIALLLLCVTYLISPLVYSEDKTCFKEVDVDFTINACQVRYSLKNPTVKNEPGPCRKDIPYFVSLNEGFLCLNENQHKRLVE